MWVKALDIILSKLKETRFPFTRVAAISGCGQVNICNVKSFNVNIVCFYSNTVVFIGKKELLKYYNPWMLLNHSMSNFMVNFQWPTPQFGRMPAQPSNVGC